MVDGDKQKIIFMAGMPASGKTSLSFKLCEKFGFRHISAGECLREELGKPNSDLSQLIRSYIDKGEIVPGHITLSLMKNKIDSLGWGKYVIIIDGFPRNLDNVTCWVNEMSDIVDVIYLVSLECSFDKICERLRIRKAEIERSDDKESVLKNRIRVFHEETEPVVLTFIAASKGAIINADDSFEVVWNKLETLVLSLGFKLLD
ncbi:UMP-CMP kinase [Theileria orientalis strain Shintoku]|uniref:UMP-CMP kinase n=1 Tax=Theileria orientalis strain Shintoku TaxID=869250 RepID=J4C3H2_THEOR|nr:UMP-CMP kinase [Theileria orientalis strain Shintoku]PVC52148.1 UMP-CMP kinase [Theileria orientalis]BAM40436.1 UMP-CMP kinase [Theileria orientalis strain Shintoku]|eukprot:XP_009690737.1 UMP-CMP kinase [Theileria orientalis strain Shintoku]